MSFNIHFNNVVARTIITEIIFLRLTTGWRWFFKACFVTISYINSVTTKYFQKYFVRRAIFKQPQDQGTVLLSRISTSV